jgi:hypothetical protein
VARRASVALLALAPLVGGCASPRVVRLENEILRFQNAQLTDRVSQLEATAGRPDDYVRRPDLDAVSRFLDRAGYVHQRSTDGRAIRLDYAGKHASFGVRVQHFERQGALFVATVGYLRLEQATDSRSAVMLLVQMAALNYEILIGKFQLDPESGEVLLSAEIALDDGLGFDTFVRVIDAVTRTADERYPELARAAGGRGL